MNYGVRMIIDVMHEVFLNYETFNEVFLNNETIKSKYVFEFRCFILKF